MLTESVVEDAPLGWLEAPGWYKAHSPDIAPDAAGAERTDYGEVVLEQRLRDALRRFNPNLPTAALDGAFRKLARTEGMTLEARNRAFHRMVVNGVMLGYTAPATARFGAPKPSSSTSMIPDSSDWSDVKQFAVVENKHVRRLEGLHPSGPLACCRWTARDASRRRACVAELLREASPGRRGTPIPSLAATASGRTCPCVVGV